MTYLDAGLAWPASRKRQFVDHGRRPSAAVAKARPLIEGYSANIFHVGETAGLGQRMKVVNNALTSPRWW